MIAFWVCQNCLNMVRNHRIWSRGFAVLYQTAEYPVKILVSLSTKSQVPLAPADHEKAYNEAIKKSHQEEEVDRKRK
jgi:hypothetical protein